MRVVGHPAPEDGLPLQIAALEALSGGAAEIGLPFSQRASVRTQVIRGQVKHFVEGC